MTARKSVCQDFQVLMRTEVKIPIPVAYPVIRDFYQAMTDTVLRWTTEREGERLREAYLAAETRERARYRTKLFRVWGEVLPTNGDWFALVCHARQIGRHGAETQSSLQVWNLPEQTLLPSKEIIFRFQDSDIAKYLTNFRKIGKKHLKKKKEYAIMKQ